MANIIHISGADSAGFLQNIITNDIGKLGHAPIIYSCLLTPQGKFLYDFFISNAQNDGYFIDINDNWIDEFVAVLKKYRLRSKVDIEVRDDLCVVLSDKSMSEQSSKDPRHDGLGYRTIVPASSHSNPPWCHPALDAGSGEVEVVEKNPIAAPSSQREIPHQVRDDRIRKRITLGIPDGYHDMAQNESYPLHFLLDKYGAIDFQKGCYVGQEVTARSKHRGKLKKQLYHISADVNLPAKNTPLMLGDKNIGFICSAIANNGLAICNIDNANKSGILCGDVAVRLKGMV